MPFKAATCPSCSGSLQVPDDRDKVKCMYCGNDVIVRQAIQLASGVNTKNFMELAQAAIVANNHKEAYDYYTKVLEAEPNNAEAWEGKGTSSGWLSTIKDIKTIEMIACFNNSLKYSMDPDKEAYQKHLANIINNISVAIYNLARKHLDQFVQVDNTWPEYIQQCQFIISALEVAYTYDNGNQMTMKNIIHICQDNIKGVRFNKYDGDSGFVFLTDNYEAALNAKVNQYEEILIKHDPTYVKVEAKRSENKPLTGGEKAMIIIGVAAVIIIMTIYFVHDLL